MNRATLLLPLLLLSAGAAPAAAQFIGPGQTINGRLERSDPVLSDGSYYDDYTYSGPADQTIEISLSSRAFDALVLWGTGRDGSFQRIDADDDGAGGTDSRLRLTVGAGRLTIRVNSIESAAEGAYTLSIAVVGTGATQASTASSESSSAGEVQTLSPGQMVDGRLEPTHPSFDDGSHYQAYRYEAAAGERLVISLDSEDFDTYLAFARIDGSDVEMVDNDDDSGDGTNSRLELTVDRAGTYYVIANAYGASELGRYTLLVESSAASSARTLPVIAAGRAVNGRLESSDPVMSDNTHYKLYAYDGRPGEQVVVTMTSSDFDAYMSGGRLAGERFVAELRDDDSGGGTNAQFVATVGNAGTLVIQANSLGTATGAFTLTVQPVGAATSPTRRPMPAGLSIAAGQQVNGTLQSSAPMLPDSSHYDQYIYNGQPGDRLRITLRSSDFDTYMRWGRIENDRFQSELNDDDGAGGTDSQVEVTVGGTGTYAIQANSFEPRQTGSYTLTIEPLGAAPATPATTTRTASRAGGKWMPSISPSTNPSFRQLAQRVREQRTLEQVSDELNSRFAVPRNVPVLMAECDQVNAFFSPRDEQITFCYELVQHLAQTFVGDDQWSPSQQEAVDGAMRFILIHEVGHALVHVLDLPITGREEDAVDQLAAVLLIEGGEKGAQAAMNGVLAIQSGSREFEELELAGEHSLGPQRLYNVACWIYGSDPQKYSGLVTNGHLPESRAVRCPSEYERLQKAWMRILAPHVAVREP